MVLENLQYVSIIIEAIVAILGLVIVFNKKKNYGWGIFLTFTIYVFYDFAKFMNYTISSDVLTALFLVASLSMLWVAWVLSREYFANQTDKYGKIKRGRNKK
jgi:hypothetical protein